MKKFHINSLNQKGLAYRHASPFHLCRLFTSLVGIRPFPALEGRGMTCLSSFSLYLIVAVTSKELFAAKEVADKPEEIERTISINLPTAVTKPCRERIRVKSLSLSLPS